MIQVTAQTRIRVAVEPADFRRGIDGLAKLCREELEEDPFTGTLFVFRNRRKTAIKILAYDGQGFWLCQKRRSDGRFRHWPSGSNPASELESHELSVLLSGGDPGAAKGAPPWRPVKPPT
jgi:transposase